MRERLYYDLRGAQSVMHPERGIARWVTNLAKAIVASKRVADLWLVVDDGRPIPEFAEDLLDTARLVTPREVPSPDAANQVVFHLTSPFEFDYRVSDLIPPRLRSPAAAVVATLYDVIPLVFPDSLRKDALDLWSARLPILDLADRILAISEYSARDAVERVGFDPQRVRVVGTGVPPPIPLPEDKRPRVTPYVLYAGGTEHPRKNISALIRAFALLNPSTRDAHDLVLVGRMTPETEDELRGEADVAGVSRHTIFTGLVGDEELASLYAAAACFAYPSRYEGFGLPIAEAMAHGAPVVASRTTSCGELLPGPEAGFDPDDVADIAATLERVLSDRALAKRLRVEGRQIASRLTWEGVADRCIDAYEDVLESSRQARSFAFGHQTTTFVSESMPDPSTPAAAFLQTAVSAAEIVRTEVATPAVFAMGPVGSLTPSRAVGNAGLMHGPLCALVDSPESAAYAAELLVQQDGVAILWELDLALGPRGEGRGPVRRILDSGALVLVGDDIDAARLPAALGRSPETRTAILPIPISWNASGPAAGHTLPFEATMMIARRRRPSRGARSMQLVVASRPPSYGRWRRRDLFFLARLTAELNLSGKRTRIVVLGDSAEEDRKDASSLANYGHAGGGLFIHTWPAFEEMCALFTAADAMVALAEGGHSLADARERQAILAGVPLVAGSRPRVAPEASTHVTTSEASGWAEAVAAALDNPPYVPTPAELGRTPGDAASTLVAML